MRTRSSGPITEGDDDQHSSFDFLSRGSDDIVAARAQPLVKPHTVVTTKEKRKSEKRGRDGPNTTPAKEQTTAWEAASTTVTDSEKDSLDAVVLAEQSTSDKMADSRRRRAQLRSPWSCSLLTLTTSALSILLLVTIVQSFLTRQLDPKGCRMSYMRAAFAKFSDFDTEHTRFASKYSLYLYREGGIDEDTRVKGVPVLFIPGNAGSYKQVRPLAAEAAVYFHDVLRHDQDALKSGKLPLDFFSVDFNEDITAFHGQTLLDQAEYLIEAVAYILSLYHDPHRSARDPDLPDPSSVVLVGHSMGGIVARTMLTMPNYQSNFINTIITLSAPHARAPVSFDSDIVRIYQNINQYWRESYSQQEESENPLSQVTLVSIAGGGLDTVVPSDYSALASIVPPTHGFTVFTATIPHVWTGMDHLSITWCDQFRKSVVRSLYDVIDARRPAQTVSREQRMRAFKKRFLTGLEDGTDKSLPGAEPQTLLTLEDNSNAIISQGERLVLRTLGNNRQPKAHLLPIPPQGEPGSGKFSLLTNEMLDGPGENGALEVLFCSVFPLQPGLASAVFSMNMDLSGNSTGSTRLACTNAAADVIPLPASTRDSKFAFDDAPPFSYLQYKLDDLVDHQFVAVIDKAIEPTSGWVIAELSSASDSIVRSDIGLRRLLTNGLSVKLPETRPLVTEIKIPAVHSSLLSYKLSIRHDSCADGTELFTPLMRQYIEEPYESKYFVNVKEANMNLHGVAPYMPPPLSDMSAQKGVSLQIWSDVTCQNPIEVELKVDILGSMGKLVMRYRTAFAAFPLLVVAMVLRKQFKIYDESGLFMSFAESMDQCLRTSLPVLFLALTFLAISLSKSSQLSSSSGLLSWNNAATETPIDFTKNDLLLGSGDPFFSFLVPFFGLITVGVCIALNYAALAIIHVLTFCYTHIRSVTLKNDDGRRTSTSFAVTSPWQRIITTGVLVLMVSTIIPYQFAYMVICLVQIATCVRALRIAQETRSGTNYNFYNYAHSLLVLMLWVLPINIPVLIVWIRNLAVHWLTPFSSHHNILSIMPYIVLVETLSTGRMVPRLTSRARYITNVFLFCLAVYAAVYGVTYAYLLHQLVNILCAWLVAIHVSGSSFSLSGLSQMLDGHGSEGKSKKSP